MTVFFFFSFFNHWSKQQIGPVGVELWTICQIFKTEIMLDSLDQWSKLLNTYLNVRWDFLPYWILWRSSIFQRAQNTSLRLVINGLQTKPQKSYQMDQIFNQCSQTADEVTSVLPLSVETNSLPSSANESFSLLMKAEKLRTDMRTDKFVILN